MGKETNKKCIENVFNESIWKENEEERPSDQGELYVEKMNGWWEIIPME